MSRHYYELERRRRPARFCRGVPDGVDFSWADGRALESPSSGVDDVGFLVALVDRLSHYYGINGWPGSSS